MQNCTDDRHPMYEPNCPGCNPTGYAALLADQPQQVRQSTPQPADAGQEEQRVTRVTEGYSDRY